MKLYLAADGFYVGTQAEAKKLGKGWEQIDIPTDKEGLIEHLNRLIADGDEMVEKTNAIMAALPYKSHPADGFEEAFDGMSLQLQLHYAAKAMENARDKL